MGLIIPGMNNSVRIIIVAAGLAAVPFQAAGAAFDVVLGAVVPFPTATDAGHGVDARGVVGFHLLHEAGTPRYPVAGRLVAGGQHDERGVVAIGVEDGAALVGEVGVDSHSVAQLHAVVRP